MANFLPLIATLAVVARFYTRRMKRVKLGLDDWLSLLALASCFGKIYTLSTSSCRSFITAR